MSDVPGLDNAREFLRMWAAPGGNVTCAIEPRAIAPDPAAFGIALVDAARHGALAYAQAVGISPEDAQARIWEGFDAERGNPTDAPKPTGPTGRVN